MRILLVEDDDRIAQPLAEDLEHQHHLVDIARDGEQGWECAQATDYDLILLDIMLPRLDGITLCKRLRADGFSAFILMLTARDTTADKVIGLDAGADDYLVKPFELEEIEARVRAFSRRGDRANLISLAREDLQLDLVACKVMYKETPLNLTPKEYMLMELFLRHPTRIFSRSALIDKLWSFDRCPGEDAVKTHIKGLRQKLKAVGASEDIIETVHGMGYRLRSPAPAPPN
ncbi:response regulator transcription factor [Pseudanabaena sp. PCC 6802]|uniref:response regulator transcription factor n=1 Tax=Pseudanabaena sp. PCC 6802 TaxID=118173 RepID=UPI000349AEE4|nr:response regulator transcription factor [Pseudanabaena sp. PCC 6802]